MNGMKEIRSEVVDAAVAAAAADAWAACRTAAQPHGGPFPSSTQPFTTSVGYDAMDRVLRPVALQHAPAWLLARQGQPC